jgi:hypothetical protein
MFSLLLYLIVASQCLCSGVQYHFNKRYEKVEDEPDVNELHVRCVWQGFRNADEDGGQHKQRGQVYGYDGCEV